MCLASESRETEGCRNDRPTHVLQIVEEHGLVVTQECRHRRTEFDEEIVIRAVPSLNGAEYENVRGLHLREDDSVQKVPFCEVCKVNGRHGRSQTHVHFILHIPTPSEGMISCTWSSPRLAVDRREMAFVVLGARVTWYDFRYQNKEETLHDVHKVIRNVPCA